LALKTILQDCGMGLCLPKNTNLPQGLARRKMGMPMH
jgi:hypothetical protein